MIKYLKRYILVRKWKKKNSDNFTTVANHFPLEQVTVGQGTYGMIYAQIYNVNAHLKIGNYCSIAPGVKFIVDAEHYQDHISLYPFRVKISGERYEATSKGDIIVADDVWIGENAIILSGITIGQGAVIAAGAVVTKDVPPYAVVGGNPARVIKYRFSEELIEELLKIDFGRLTKEMIRDHIDDLYQKLETVEQLDWLPRKGIS